MMMIDEFAVSDQLWVRPVCRKQPCVHVCVRCIQFSNFSIFNFVSCNLETHSFERYSLGGTHRATCVFLVVVVVELRVGVS